MMHFAQSNKVSCSHSQLNVIFMLVVSQSVLFCYLLAHSITDSLIFTLAVGVPVAWFVRSLLSVQVKRYLTMSIVMFAAGGFGMLLGAAFDLGQVGVYGILSICQTASSITGWGVDLLWVKFQLTPWTYIGMFVGSNLGMLFLDDLCFNHSLPLNKLIYLYAVCNVGMLLGMVLAELASTQFIPYLNDYLAAALMVVSMLLGMVFGMVVLLAIVNKLTKQQLFSDKINLDVFQYD